jgi:large subunit ribosomal protein L22
MADEKKKTTKKSESGKAAAEKGAAKRAAAKDDTKAQSKKAAGRKAAAKGKAAKKDAPKAGKGGEKGKAGKGKSAKGAGKKDTAKKAPAKKEAAKAKLAPIVVRASSRYVRVAPRKARLVADQVRGMHIDRARALLQFSPRNAARDISKLIESAAANAENNHDLVADEMRVAEITVDEGPTLRRYRPRALGRATPIHKRTSHIAVALSPDED